MIREDWILRLIRDLAELVGKIARCVERRDFNQAIEQAAEAWSDVLGVPRELVDRVDAPTLASLLREPARLRGGAQLLAAEARAYAAKGDPLHAALCYRRAFELFPRGARAGPHRRG